MASTPFKKAELQKVKIETYTTPHGDFVSHHYTLYHPDLPRMAKVIATIPYYDKKVADINIIGNREDYNKVGVSNIRNLKKQIMSDLNVDAVSGVRTGGARIKLGSGPKRVTIKESEDHKIEKIESTKIEDRDNTYHLVKYKVTTPSRSFTIKGWKYEKDKQFYVSDIDGNVGIGSKDYNTVGKTTMRKVAQHIKNDLGVTHFAGQRVGGARRGPARDRNKSYNGTVVKIRESNVEGLEIYHDDKTEVGKQIYHTFFVEHPKLGHKRIYVNTIQHRNKKWEGEIEVGGNDPGKLGPAAVRHVMRHIRQVTGINRFVGQRETGAGRGRIQSIDFLKESNVEGLVIKRIHIDYDDNMVQHSYKIFHPNLSHPIQVHGTKYFKRPELARMNVGGNDIGKLGPAVVRHVARYIANDMKITQYSGHRTGGAGPGRIQKVTIKEKAREPDEYDTQDLDEFSEHLRNKHGAHVELYRTHDGHVNLQTLIVPKELRNQGIASAVIKDIKKYSNRNKVNIILNAEPLDDKTKEKKLIGFYKSHGFVENKGRNKDYSLGGLFGKNSMYSVPSTKGGTQKSL